MPGLDDYGALIRSGQATVPDYATEELHRQQLAVQRSQETRLEQAAALELAEQTGFQHDLATIMTHPTAQGYSALIAKHPKFAQQVKSSWDVMDGARRDADLQSMSEIYSAAASGKHDLAAALMKRRIEADKAAGQAEDPHDQAILDALDSGDPIQQKGALGMIGVTLSAVTGPDKFEQTLGALTKGHTPELRNVGPGENVVSIDPETGKAASIYESPYLKGPDDAMYVRDGTNASPAITPASATAAAPGSGPAGGFDSAVDFVLKHEGGYNPSDANGSPVNFGINQGANPDVDVKNLTKDQARELYRKRYWEPSGADKLPAAIQTPYFDTYVLNPQRAKQFLAESGGDPGKFLDLRAGWLDSLSSKPDHAKYDRAWDTRTADLRAQAGGQPEPYYSPGADTPGTPDGAPPGYRTLIPGKRQARVLTAKEAEARGLSTAKVYELRPDGTVTAVGDSTEGGGGPLKPAALEAAAVSYIKTGKMPAGMGGQALKNQILNYVPTIMDRHGLTPDDMPSIQQQFQADSKAFSQRIGQLSYMRQSVGKLNQHAQDLSALIKAVPAQGNFKPFNWITQGVEGQFSNSTITQLQAGLPLFEAEVARVMTGNPNSGAGQLSDNARHEFAVLSSMAAPKAKIDAVNRIMKMVEESVRATRDETTQLKQRIGGGIDVYAGKAMSAPQRTVVRTGHDKSGRRVVQYSDGTVDYAD